MNAEGKEYRADVLIVGGGLGGVAAALTAADMGASVIIVEEMAWLGGQLTAQGVPLDEYPWNETLVFSRTYADFRARIRQFYRDNYPLTAQARSNPLLNPGMGNVSTLAHEPRVSVQVIEALLAPYRGSGRINVFRRCKLISAESLNDRITGVSVRHLPDRKVLSFSAHTVIDASETGELLHVANVEHVLGAESQNETGEPHALPGDPDPLNQPAITWTFAADYRPSEDHVIAKPASYDRWLAEIPAHWPGPRFSFTIPDHVTHEPRSRPLFAGDSDEEYLFDLWHARRIAYRKNFADGAYQSDITLACWPQNEYWNKPVLGVSPEETQTAFREARELSLSFVYWLQTEAPRHDGKGYGYPGLRLRGDVLGTTDGLAMQAYYRTAYRLKSEFTLLEQHISVDARSGFGKAEEFFDTVGIVAYRIDIHHSTRGDNTVDIDTYPFQIPLGSLLPVRVDNLLAASKNIGATRVTSSACRVHPAEWSTGEACGALAVFAQRRSVPPREVRRNRELLSEFQSLLASRKIMLKWPPFGPLTAMARIGYRPPPK
ncbi:MAG: FAD-dependent oxidoreductase [Bradyrhizobiaceae bacterium]|nr:FAD-dependent oxidoreductase [Bradyrhizobiaceae bacterium]